MEARLYRPALPRGSHQLAPDFGVVHQELKRPVVTLMLLWDEYATGNLLAYKYTSFCIKYREFALRQQRSMRQVHIAGEKLFVDYAGDAVPIVDPVTVETTRAQIFVATRAATRELCRVMLGIARPELLPEAPLGQFLREDAAVRIKRMRARADREDFPESATVPAPPVACARPEEAPKPTGKRGQDRTVYVFVLPGGAEVNCTRWELQQRALGSTRARWPTSCMA